MALRWIDMKVVVEVDEGGDSLVELVSLCQMSQALDRGSDQVEEGVFLVVEPSLENQRLILT